LALNNGFTFNNDRKDYVMTIGKRRTYWAPIKRQLTTVPNRPGALLSGTDTDVRVIEVDVEVSGDSAEELRKHAEDFAAWLITDEAKELVFDDELDRVYNAVIEGTFSADEIVSHGYGTITFICPDPYKYSEEKAVEFANVGTFMVNGSLESDPVIRCEIKADTTYVAVSDGERINLIGNPAKQEEIPYDPETPVLVSSANTLTGWTTSSTVSIEASDLTGVLKTDGNSYYTDDYGTSPNWHGPAMKKSLGTPLTNFRFDVGLSMVKTDIGQAGGIEVALLDASSVIVAKISLTKHYGGINTESVTVRAGTLANGHDVLTGADYPFDFNGVVRVYRSGNSWTAQVFYLKPDGNYLSPVTHTWLDTAGIASAPVAQVQARLIQRASFPVTDQKISDINVYKLNDPTAGQVPIIARAGDIIEFDHTNDEIRKNGEDFTKQKAFIGDYFSLSPGQNTIVAEPSDAIQNTEVRWRDRWR
jgi:predicted phage tail component-like protein